MSEVTKAKVSDSELTATIDVLPEDVPRGVNKKAVLEEAGEFLIDALLQSAGNKKSPVKGESWSALSKDYKKFKKKQGSTPVANMELFGDYLDSLDYSIVNNKIKIGWVGDQAPKADGHHNWSGKSKIPTRPLLPNEGESFKQNIESKLEQIVLNRISEQKTLKKSDLKNIDTKRQLFDILKEQLGDYSNAKLSQSIMANPKTFEMFKELGLLKWLVQK